MDGTDLWKSTTKKSHGTSYYLYLSSLAKIKKKQENKENTSGKNAFTCFFLLSLSMDNKTETSDGEARRNHTIPTG